MNGRQQRRDQGHAPGSYTVENRAVGSLKRCAVSGRYVSQVGTLSRPTLSLAAEDRATRVQRATFMSRLMHSAFRLRVSRLQSADDIAKRWKVIGTTAFNLRLLSAPPRAIQIEIDGLAKRFFVTDRLKQKIPFTADSALVRLVRTKRWRMGTPSRSKEPRGRDGHRIRMCP